MITKHNKITRLAQILTIVLMLLVALPALATWTPPPAGTPPECPSSNPGCNPPINVSNDTQIKTGKLDLGILNPTYNPLPTLFGTGNFDSVLGKIFINGIWYPIRRWITSDVDNVSIFGQEPAGGGVSVGRRNVKIYDNLNVVGTTTTENLVVNNYAELPTNTYICTGTGVCNLITNPGGSSQWQDTAGGIYYNAGNVAVGTTLPTEKLDVNGTLRVRGGNGLRLTDTTALATSWYLKNTGLSFLMSGNDGQDRMRISNIAGNNTVNFYGKVNSTGDICTTVSGTAKCLDSVGGGSGSLPSGTTNQTLRYDATTGWTGDSFLRNISNDRVIIGDNSNDAYNFQFRNLGSSPYTDIFGSIANFSFGSFGGITFGTLAPDGKNTIYNNYTSVPANSELSIFGNSPTATNRKVTIYDNLNVVGTTTTNVICTTAGICDLTQDIINGGSSQWTNTASGVTPAGIYYNTGNVGIGTNAPKARLSLGSSPLPAYNENPDKRLAIYQDPSGTNFYGLGIRSSHLDFLAGGDTAATGMTIEGGGNVGIGVTDPGKKLDILTNVAPDGIRIKRNGGNSGPNGVSQTGLSINAGNEHPWLGYVDGLSFIPNTYTALGTWIEDPTKMVRFDSDGSVSIGKVNADSGYKLDVNGFITGDGLSITGSGVVTNDLSVADDLTSHRLMVKGIDSRLRIGPASSGTGGDPALPTTPTWNIDNYSVGNSPASDPTLNNNSLRIFKSPDTPSANWQPFSFMMNGIGNVGLGVEPTATERLKVNGNILAKEGDICTISATGVEKCLNSVSGGGGTYSALTGGGLALLNASNAFYIDTGGVTNAKIGAGAVDAAKLADGAVTNAKIGNYQVSSAKIVDNTIDAIKLNTGGSGAIGNVLTKTGATSMAWQAPTGGLSSGTADGQTLRWDGNNWVTNSFISSYSNMAKVGKITAGANTLIESGTLITGGLAVGGTAIPTSAKLDVTGDTKISGNLSLGGATIGANTLAVNGGVSITGGNVSIGTGSSNNLSVSGTISSGAGLTLPADLANVTGSPLGIDTNGRVGKISSPAPVAPGTSFHEWYNCNINDGTGCNTSNANSASLARETGTKTFILTCPAGKRIVSGGGRVDNSVSLTPRFLTENRASTLTSWRVSSAESALGSSLPLYPSQVSILCFSQ